MPREGEVSCGSRLCKTRSGFERSRFTCVVLDEAHKARRQDLKDGTRGGEGNNLLEFMRTMRRAAATFFLAPQPLFNSIL